MLRARGLRAGEAGGILSGLTDDLDDPLPDHSSLSRRRERLGLATFDRFFERVVELCQEAELVWGKELFIDATKVREPKYLLVLG
jgi:transposase